MALHLSIAIPTFNGRQRLPQVLEHLRTQVVSPEVEWDIWVIDNNSEDGTAAYVAELQCHWDGPAPLHYCHEPRQGVAFARQRAIAATTSLWVGFIDDDNWPDADWVMAAYRFSQEHPEFAAFGSRIVGEYEVPPPAGFEKIERFLAIRDHGNDLQPFCPEQLNLPPGAGLVVHRQRWLEAVPTTLALTGRQPGSCVSGDDYVALLHLHLAGGVIGYNPRMGLRHYIPARRLTWAYLLPLAYGMGLSTCPMLRIGAGPFRSFVLGLRTCGGALRRIVRSLVRSRGTLDTDLALSFQLFFYWGCCLSPLYAMNPRLAQWLSFDRVQSIQKLWQLFLFSSRPSTPPQPSPAPSNQS